MKRKRAALNDGHVSFHLDRQTLAAIDEAAAREERTKSDWIRRVLRQELRRLGLIPEGAPSRQTGATSDKEDQ